MNKSRKEIVKLILRNTVLIYAFAGFITLPGVYVNGYELVTLTNVELVSVMIAPFMMSLTAYLIIDSLNIVIDYILRKLKLKKEDK